VGGGIVLVGIPMGIPIVTLETPWGVDNFVPAFKATELANVSSAVSRYFLRYR
jgi:hypothetical protein